MSFTLVPSADGTKADLQVSGVTVLTAYNDGRLIAVASPSVTDDSKRLVTTEHVRDVVPGIDQTWQNVTGSRAVSTNYYNTTGKPIYVSIQLAVSMNSSNAVFYVNGLQISQSGGGLGTSNSVYAFVGGVVPPGASYQLGAGGGSIIWNELR